METSSDLDALLEHYQETLDSYNAIGGDDFEQVIRRKLNLANLNKLENQMVSKLSGGEFKIIQVIREMLNSPDLMIMDEPDVFLDFDNLNSLKNLINSHKGTMLVVTHNRYLLNNCFNKILHLENKELQGKILNEANTILNEFLEAGFKTNNEVQSYLQTMALRMNT